MMYDFESCEFEISDKQRFYPKLDQRIIDTLNHPFVVGNLEKTKCFHVLSRPVELSQQFKKLLGNDTDNIEEINELLKNIPIAIVRREISEDGTKNDKKLRIQLGSFNYISSIVCGCPYQYSYVNVNFEGTTEDVGIQRVFVLEKDIPKLFK